MKKNGFSNIKKYNFSTNLAIDGIGFLHAFVAKLVPTLTP
jgi:hypothetical protein